MMNSIHFYTGENCIYKILSTLFDTKIAFIAYRIKFIQE
jgi:hypothetical protein